MKLPVPTVLNINVCPSQNSPFVADVSDNVGVVTPVTINSEDSGEDDEHVAIVSLTLYLPLVATEMSVFVLCDIVSQVDWASL